MCATENIDQELKIKVQELRLYETALMQGIHSIKSVVNDAPTIDVEVIRSDSFFYRRPRSFVREFSIRNWISLHRC